MPKIKPGATSAARLVPLVKMPLPSVRSRGSIIRAITRMPPGQLADSTIPRNSRKISKATKPFANPVSTETKDHRHTADANAQRRLTRSRIGPTAICETV